MRISPSLDFYGNNLSPVLPNKINFCFGTFFFSHPEALIFTHLFIKKDT